MTDTDTIKTYDADDIADYLDDGPATEEHDLGNIFTCVRVISKYPFGDVRRDHDILVAAADSLMIFFGDFRVFLEKVAVEKIDGNQIVLTDS